MLRSIGIAFVICLISAPMAIVITIVFYPFWSWIESSFEIESIGHSGPAEWCYLASYIFSLTIIILVWKGIKSKNDE